MPRPSLSHQRPCSCANAGRGFVACVSFSRLADDGRAEEARAELARAAACEEQVAYLLEAEQQDLEAAIHRVSAASCHENLVCMPSPPTS